MQLYRGLSKVFIDDTLNGRIAGRLTEAYRKELQTTPGPSEVRSWQESLHHMATVMKQAGLVEQGVLVEYQLPLSSKRLDCMVTGIDGNGAQSAVVVELKQWEKTSPSAIEDCVVAWTGSGSRDVLHPSRQVGQYVEYLVDAGTAFADGAIQLDGCAFLHNAPGDPGDPLFGPDFRELRSRYPLFTQGHGDLLGTWLGKRVSHGQGMAVLQQVAAGKWRPSKKLMEHTARMVAGQQVYVLLDEQLVVFNAVMEAARAVMATGRKTAIIVHGGPGTGKSVIALNLVGVLSGQGYVTVHATGSKAFTENIRALVKDKSGKVFKYFNGFVNQDRDLIDVLVLDEAHRIRKNSNTRFTRPDRKSEIDQVEELLHVAKVGVFFIDDRQIVRPQGVGSSPLIREAAKQTGTTLLEFDLEAQFRCGGSSSWISWVEGLLAMDGAPAKMWEPTEAFEFRIMDSVEDLERHVREQAALGQTARLSAGYCWPWSDPKPDGTLVDDVRIGSWAMPWNAKPDAGRLAAGIPPSNFWASDPGGIDQVGCIYTAQGFEYDWAGVIWGRDLRYDPMLGWVGDKTISHDSVVKRSKEQFLDLVKNTYRVLLTRGMKGCAVYFEDAQTREYVRRCLS